MVRPVRPWPDWFLAMVLNLHQVLNQLTFEYIPSVFCLFVVFEINSARLEYILSLGSFGCWIAI